jgi:hypothetical protein
LCMLCIRTCMFIFLYFCLRCHYNVSLQCVTTRTSMIKTNVFFDVTFSGTPLLASGCRHATPIPTPKARTPPRCIGCPRILK